MGMILKAYSVYDIKACAFANPFFMQTNGLAMRAFENECSNRDSQLNKHPDDFALYEVGTWEDIKGTFKNLDIPVRIATAREFVPLVDEKK